MALQGCGDNHYYCGEGTEAVGDECVEIGVDCGPGTHEEDGQCVLDDEVIVCGEGTEEVDGECVPITVVGEPPVIESVTSPTPYPSGGLMIIHGDNFALSDSGTTTVTVDGVATTNVQVLSNEYVIADLPVSTIALVEVELTNDNGADQADFRYTGLYASEGGGLDSGKPAAFGPIGPPEPQTLDIVDPRTGATAVVGPILAGTDPYSITGLAFAPDGTLWAVEACEQDEDAALLTIDPLTGAATVLARISVPTPIVPEAFGPPPPSTSSQFTDLAFSGTTLFAFTRALEDLVTIDTTTFAVTVIDSDVSCGEGCGLAPLDDGNFLVWYNGDVSLVEPDGDVLTTLTASTSDYVTSLTWADGTLYGFGSGLYRVDTDNGEIVQIGPGDFYDALATPPELDDTPGGIDVPPPELAAVQDLLPALDLSAYEPLAVTRTPRADRALAADAVLPANAELDHRGRRNLALRDLARGRRVTVRSEHEDRTFEVAELAGYRVVENRRGRLKLVDERGRKVMRGITEIITHAEEN